MSLMGTPVSACCRTAAICSVEKRFFFMAPSGPLGARLCRKTHSRFGPIFPEPLTLLVPELDARFPKGKFILTVRRESRPGKWLGFRFDLPLGGLSQGCP